jgi:hypothetical protein
MPQYDDDDEFENGVLRDGARRRVLMHARESQAPMIIASARLAHSHQRQRTRCSAPRQSAPSSSGVNIAHKLVAWRQALTPPARVQAGERQKVSMFSML